MASVDMSDVGNVAISLERAAARIPDVRFAVPRACRGRPEHERHARSGDCRPARAHADHPRLRRGRSAPCTSTISRRCTAGLRRLRAIFPSIIASSPNSPSAAFLSARSRAFAQEFFVRSASTGRSPHPHGRNRALGQRHHHASARRRRWVEGAAAAGTPQETPAAPCGSGHPWTRPSSGHRCRCALSEPLSRRFKAFGADLCRALERFH